MPSRPENLPDRALRGSARSSGTQGTAVGSKRGTRFMSIKSKVFAATAALTMLGGAGAIGATPARAATPSCGRGTAQFCINFFSRDCGTHRNPQFLLDVLRQGEKVGQPIILFRQSNSDPALDF